MYCLVSAFLKRCMETGEKPRQKRVKETNEQDKKQISHQRLKVEVTGEETLMEQLNNWGPSDFSTRGILTREMLMCEHM